MSSRPSYPGAMRSQHTSPGPPREAAVSSGLYSCAPGRCRVGFCTNLQLRFALVLRLVSLLSMRERQRTEATSWAADLRPLLPFWSATQPKTFRAVLRVSVGIVWLLILGAMPLDAFVLPSGAMQPIQSLIVRDTESTPFGAFLSAEFPPLSGGDGGDVGDGGVPGWGHRSPGARPERAGRGGPVRHFWSGGARHRPQEGPVLPSSSLAPPALWFGQGGERCCEPPSATACI